MIELLEGALRFPTVVPTVMLGIVLVYWACVLVGLLDIDLFSLDAGVELDAAGDGLSATSAIGPSGSVDFGSAPVSVIASVCVLFAWTGTYVMSAVLGPVASSLALGASLLVGTTLVSLAATSQILRPFRRFFATVPALKKRSLIGRTCTVTTLRVTDHHGQAVVEDGAAGVTIQIRSSEPERLGKGTEALIFDYAESEDVFLVKPMPPGLGLAADD